MPMLTWFSMKFKLDSIWLVLALEAWDTFDFRPKKDLAYGELSSSLQLNS